MKNLAALADIHNFEIDAVPFWNRIRQECPWVRLDNLKSIARGDVNSAESLLFQLTNADRATFARWVMSLPYPKEVQRAVLAGAWEHDHSHVINEAGTTRRLIDWFKTAEFPTDHLPEAFPVWRGTRLCSLSQARRGMSWSTEKATACWFALRRARPEDMPSVIVLRRDITRQEVLFHWIERNEDEVLLKPGGGVRDGDIDEWRKLAREAKVNQ